MSIPVVIDVRDVDFADLKLDLECVDMALTTLEEVGWRVLRAAIEQGKAEENLLEDGENYYSDEEARAIYGLIFPDISVEEVVFDEQDEND